MRGDWDGSVGGATFVRFAATGSSGKPADFDVLHTTRYSTLTFIVIDHHLWKINSQPVELLLIFRLRAD
jgi:hypothetical protein